MAPEVRDAIESARSASREGPIIRRAEPQRRHSFDHIRALVLSVVRELPDDMLVRELRDELEIVENQGA